MMKMRAMTRPDGRPETNFVFAALDETTDDPPQPANLCLSQFKWEFSTLTARVVVVRARSERYLARCIVVVSASHLEHFPLRFETNNGTHFKWKSSSCFDSRRFRSFVLVLCRFLKIRNRESQFLLPFSERRNCESKMIPFLFILRFFWPTIPEKRPKTVKELELRFFWNWNRRSPRTDAEKGERKEDDAEGRSEEGRKRGRGWMNGCKQS